MKTDLNPKNMTITITPRPQVVAINKLNIIVSKSVIFSEDKDEISCI